MVRDCPSQREVLGRENLVQRFQKEKEHGVLSD